jgi:3D (Asp-Asp-Asp) domain-containing protein
MRRLILLKYGACAFLVNLNDEVCNAAQPESLTSLATFAERPFFTPTLRKQKEKRVSKNLELNFLDEKKVFKNETDDLLLQSFLEPRKNEIVRAMNLWATWYYTPTFESSPAKKIPLLTLNGKELGVRLSRDEFCDGAAQGSFRVRKKPGQDVFFNVSGLGSALQVDCKFKWRFRHLGRTRFQTAIAPLGNGGKSFRVVPYRSIAVDPAVIPFGSVIFIPQARGTKLTLPSGHEVIHDGYFFAADRGGAIEKNHIDVFLGPHIKNPFEWVKSEPKGIFKAYIVKNERIKLLMKEVHSLLGKEQPVLF